MGWRGRVVVLPRPTNERIITIAEFCPRSEGSEPPLRAPHPGGVGTVPGGCAPGYLALMASRDYFRRRHTRLALWGQHSRHLQTRHFPCSPETLDLNLVPLVAARMSHYCSCFSVTYFQSQSTRKAANWPWFPRSETE